MKYLVVLKYGGWKSWMFRAGLWEYQEGLRSSRRIQNWSKEHHPFRSLLLFIPSAQSRSILLFVTLTIFSPDGCLFSDDAPLPQEAHHFWENCAALTIISLFYFVCLLWATPCGMLGFPDQELNMQPLLCVSVQSVKHWTTREVPLFLCVVSQSDYLQCSYFICFGG